MIVGVGRAPKRLLEELRKLIDDPRIFIFPEFFDDKRYLLSSRRDRVLRYVERVARYRSSVVFAIYPDYCNRLSLLCDLFSDILWIYPLHSLKEVEDGLPWCIDWLGYASDPRYRNYSLQQFLDIAKRYGFRTWFLGANAREVPIAINNGFDGVDVTTLSVPKVMFRDIKHPSFPNRFALFLKRIASGEAAIKPLVSGV